MTANHQNKKTKRALAIALSAALMLAPVTLLSGCGTSEEETENTETTQTDTQRIQNGNFEFYTESETTVIVTSPNNWTRSSDSSGSSSALSSARASGIVNTNKSDWENMTESKTALPDEETAAELWDEASIYDRLKFYDECDIDSTSDFEDYVSYNIDIDDVPTCENPGTHDYDGTADSDGETNVLMIHNYRSDGYGTAQKYTAGTQVTLSANTSAKLSVWVKTADLTFNNGTEVSKNRGAYISVTQTVGGTTYDPFEIKNIDTSSVTENNGWQLYTLYLRGDALQSSSFTIVLGLGHGGGNNKFEYVQGYAFFDDVTCEIIDNEAYEAATVSVPSCDTEDEGEDRVFEADNLSDTVFASDLYRAEDKISSLSAEIAPTVEKYGNVSYTSVPSRDGKVYRGLTLDASSDLLLFESADEIRARSGNRYLDKFVTDGLGSYPFDNSDDMIVLLSAGGAAYTAKVSAPSFKLAPESYLLITFWVKTSEMNGYTGASASVVDVETKSTITAFDSTTVATVDTDEKTDLYNGWVKCAFLVANTTKSEKTFSLEFSYGPTTIVGTTNASYLPGYAAFTNFASAKMSKAEYNAVTTGSYIQTISLYNNTQALSSTGFDSVIYSDDSAIEEGLGTPQNYTGVDGGSIYVGGTDYSYANSNENAGLLNKAYAQNYWNNNASWITELLRIATSENTSLTNALNADNWWNKIIGTSNQPLLIVNTVEQSYGYIGKSTSISTSTYRAISVKVKVSKGAVAYIYLMDTTSLTDGYNTPLTLETPTVTYWYDDDNNVCAVDPASDEFDDEKDIVYLYNNNEDEDKNGLYRRADGSDDKNYANLSAYEKDDDNNLITADELVAFWYNPEDGAYYARYDDETGVYSVPVTDFDHAYARYTQQKAECYTVVDGDDVANKWVTVNFFIHTGSESKNYRLEVFSGSRDGSVKSEAGSYVMFDTVATADLSENYSGLLTDAIDAINENKPTDYTEDDVKWYDDAIYYTFTYRDTNDYLRYDEELDTEDEGDLYADYVQSSYAETVAYLYYEDRTSSDEEYTFTTFVDFSPLETTVTPSSSDTDDDTDTDTDTATEPEYNVWLFASSIVLAVVLVIVLVLLLVKKIAKRVKMHKVHVTNAYVDPKKKK